MSETDVLQQQVYIELARLNGLQEASIESLNLAMNGQEAADVARSETIAARDVTIEARDVVTSAASAIVLDRDAVALNAGTVASSLLTITGLESEMVDSVALVVEARDLAVAARAGAELALSQFGDAEIYAIQSKEARDAAETFRDNSLVNANLAQAAADDVAANTAYQDLSGIGEDIAGTAVAGFIYDRTKDSDPTWADRCQHTEWYNEPLGTPTRGTQREFPVKSLIVAEIDKVTIYTLDFGAPEMWIVFEANNFSKGLGKSGGLTAVTISDGEMYVASTSFDLSIVNFISSRIRRFGTSNIGGHFNGNIGTRNEVLGFIANPKFDSIVSRVINDVAITIEDGAPIDPTTGLPQPTIVVGTDGGVSIIRGDNVTNIPHSGGNVVSHVHIREDGALHYTTALFSSGRFHHVFHKLPTESITNSSIFAKGVSDEFYSMYFSFNFTSLDFPLSSNANLITRGLSENLIAHDNQLIIVNPNPSNPSEGARAVITADYNTGWQAGDIKLAALIDTEAGTISEATNLITNNDSDWIHDAGTSTVAEGVLFIADDDVNTRHTNVSYLIPANTVGARVTYTISNNTANAGARILLTDEAGLGAFFVGPFTTQNGDYSIDLPPQTSVTRIAFQRLASHTGTQEISNLQLRIGGSVLDRSHNENHFEVIGSVTKTPFAEGSEIMGFTDVGLSGVISTPENNALGLDTTGDFYISTWCTATHNTYLFDTSGASRFYAIFQSSPQQLLTNTGGTIAMAGYAPDTSCHIGFGRRNGSTFATVNGVVYHGAASSHTILPEGDTLYVGTRYTLAAALPNKALFKITTTVPSEAQIKFMYEQERHMFEPNAQVTLHGTSSDVKAVSRDLDTGLVHAGTLEGLSTFKDLVNVSHDDDPVTTFIDAKSGVIARQ